MLPPGISMKEAPGDVLMEQSLTLPFLLSPPRLFPVTRSTASYLACGRVSGPGLSGGSCTDPCRWICEQSALTLQWGHGSAPPTFLGGNTTYTCLDPQ